MAARRLRHEDKLTVCTPVNYTIRDRQLIEQAAELDNMAMSEFIRNASIARAERRIAALTKREEVAA